MKDLNKYILESLVKNHIPVKGDFADLGLPSGTLWCRFNYGADDENSPGMFFDYPTLIKTKFEEGEMPKREDFEELFKYCSCKWDDNMKGYWVSNAKDRIFFKAVGIIDPDTKRLRFKNKSDGADVWIMTNGKFFDCNKVQFFNCKFYSYDTWGKLNIRLILK